MHLLPGFVCFNFYLDCNKMLVCHLKWYMQLGSPWEFWVAWKDWQWVKGVIAKTHPIEKPISTNECQRHFRCADLGKNLFQKRLYPSLQLPSLIGLQYRSKCAGRVELITQAEVTRKERKEKHFSHPFRLLPLQPHHQAKARAVNCKGTRFQNKISVTWELGKVKHKPK